MKKLLSLLSVLTISGTAVPTTIAASPYQKEKQLNSYLQTNNNLENLKRNKRETGSDCESGWSFSNGTRHYCSISPELWEEISIIMNNNLWINYHSAYGHQILSNLISDKLEKFNLRGGSSSYGLIDTIIFSFNILNNEWQKSDKKHHIRIVGSGSTCNASISTCAPSTHLISVNIREDWSIKNNKYISRLENDLKIFNLGVIKDCNDKTILNAIKEKNPNLDISKIEIVQKHDYSHFSESFSVTIKVKNGDDYYSQGLIKTNIIFNTEINLKELSDKLKNDPLIVEWLDHINDYNINLPKKINNLKEYVSSQKWNAKNVEKEIIKGYIRDLNQIVRLIENEWKINELNKTVQGLKSDIDNLKSDIDNLNYLILNLNNEKKCKGWVSKGSSVAGLIPVVGSIFSGIIDMGSNICEIANS